MRDVLSNVWRVEVRPVDRGLGALIGTTGDEVSTLRMGRLPLALEAV